MKSVLGSRNQENDSHQVVLRASTSHRTGLSCACLALRI